jgi:hypothetical protein
VNWYWWTIPAGIGIGVPWSWVLMCVIPPRVTTRQWLRAWGGTPRLPVLLAAALARRLNIRHH